MQDEEIEEFMVSIKLYFEPISNLINFESIEDYLYSEVIGDIEDNDYTMDFLITLTDFMLKNQLKTKEETLEFYDTIDNYEQSRIREIEKTEWILKKRKYELKESEKTNERFTNI